MNILSVSPGVARASHPRAGLGVALVALLLFAACAPGPEQTVRDLGAALRDGRKLDVEQRVDVARAATSAADVLLRKAASAAGSSVNPLALGLLESMKPATTASIAEAFTRFAGGGDFQLTNFFGQSSPALPRDSILAMTFRIAGAETSGTLAAVKVQVVEQKVADTFLVTLRLEQGETGWKVVGIEDVSTAKPFPTSTAPGRR